MSRVSRPIAAIGAMCLVLTACGTANRQETQGGPVRYVNNGTFTMSAVSADYGDLDPYRVRAAGSIAYLAYDSLINVQPDGTIVSGLAAKWTADANSASFTLHPGVTCSDGAPLTAGQVAADINYNTNPKNGSPLYGQVTPTIPLTASGDDTSGTVRVTMTQPFGFLLRTIGLLPIMCGKGLQDPKALSSTSDGTGAFVLSSFVEGQNYTFTRRQGYAWGPNGVRNDAPGTPAKVVVQVVTSDTTAANMLLAGQLNFARIVGDDHKRLDARGLAKDETVAGGVSMSFNQHAGRITTDKAVRTALVQALDASEVSRVATGGTGTPATGMAPRTPKACPGNTVAGQLPHYDPQAAAATLDGAGWTKGPDGIRVKDGKQLSLDLHYVPALSPNNRPMAELVAQRWSALGVKVNLAGDSVAQLSQIWTQTGNFDTYMYNIAFQLPSQYVPWYSGTEAPKGENFAGIHNPDFESNATKALSMTAPAACTYFDKAERALFRSVDLDVFGNASVDYYLKGAQAAVSGNVIPVATSIRLLAP